MENSATAIQWKNVLQKFGISTKSNFVSIVQDKRQDSELCVLCAIVFKIKIFKQYLLNSNT